MPKHRRRRGTRSAESPTGFSPITTTLEAITQAAAMHKKFGNVHGAFLLDRRGRVMDGFCLTDPAHTPLEALAMLLAGDLDAVIEPRVLLVSGTTNDHVDHELERDLVTYRDAQMWCERYGASLYDWIHASAEDFRIMSVVDDLERKGEPLS